MSTFGGRADISFRWRHVCFRPKVDIAMNDKHHAASEDSQLIRAYLDSLDGKPRIHDP
jgi:hypothetical protein